MRFSHNFLNDIKARLTISRVIGEKVTFDKRKSKSNRGDYWACCPFHHEKTPSFRYQDERASYHCFGCGESGDIFSFIMKTEGLSFAQAVAKLAEMAGLQLPSISSEDKEEEKKRIDLYDVLAKACIFFESQLYEAEQENIREYLQKRGLDTNICKQFGLGYAPEAKGSLQNYLKAHGVSVEQMQAAGLVIASEEGEQNYERFRGRITFPIKDLRARIVGFGGRSLSNDVRAKYINSPETELFHKSKIVYNLRAARDFCRRQKMQNELLSSLLIVEGYMDVIALHKVGFENAVAPLGTSLTTEHISLIWQSSKHPIVCFDGDAAGLRAAYRVIDKVMPLLNKDVSLRFVLLPNAMDPDELIKTSGIEAMQQCLTQAKPLIELLWEREVNGVALDTPEKCAGLEHRLTETVNLIQDTTLRSHYFQTIKARLRDLFYNLRKGSKQNRAPNVAFSALQNATQQLSKNLFLREKMILSLLLNAPILWREKFEQLANLQFTDARLSKLHRHMLELISEDGQLFEQEIFKKLLEKHCEAKFVAEVAQLAKKVGIDLMQIDSSDILDQALHLYMRAHNINLQLEDIAKRMMIEDLDLYKTLANIKKLLFEAEKTFIEEV